MRLIALDCVAIYPQGYGRVSVPKSRGNAQLNAGLAWWNCKYANEQPPQERLEYAMAKTKAYVDRIGL